MEPKLLSRDDELYLQSLYAAVRESIITYEYLITLDRSLYTSDGLWGDYTHAMEVNKHNQEITEELHSRLFHVMHYWRVELPEDIRRWYYSWIPF